MSTVAYRDGVMAGDQQVTEQGMMIGRVHKVFKVGSSLIGVVGDFQYVAPFLAWAQAGYPEDGKPTAPDNSDDQTALETLIVDENRVATFRTSPNFNPEPIQAEFFAMGTGRKIAFGAMRAGATPQQAIEYAAEVDIYTGGGITVVELDPA